MVSLAVALFTGGVMPPAIAVAWPLICGRRPFGMVCALWAAEGVLMVVVNAAAGQPAGCVAAAVNVVLAVLWWWWRRKRRRTVAVLRGKYVYVRDRMVRVMRDRARPGVVLRPQRGTVLPSAFRVDVPALWA